VQRRFGTPDLPRTAFCPNCHVKITPGTQICSNCNSRICTHCYQIIPSMTATVCPKCGKRDFLKKPLHDIRKETTLNKQAAESFVTETEYICPICNDKMVLLPGGTLKCQSRSCGNLLSLKEFLNNQGKGRTVPTPPPDTFGMDIASRREKTSPKFFEVAKEKVRQKMDYEESLASSKESATYQEEPTVFQEESKVFQDEPLTTSIETKAPDQYFWKSNKLGKRSGSGSKSREKDWESSGSSREINIQVPWRKIGIAARFIGLIALIALVGFGIFTGVRTLIDSNIFDNVSVSTPPVSADLAITSLQFDEITQDTAIISWVTNVPATGQIEYGISDALGYATEITSEPATTHSITVKGLEPETTYHFIAVARTGDNKQVVNSEDSTFTTTAPPDTVPPVITGVDFSNVSDIDAAITWKTDEAATGKIEYGKTSGKYTDISDPITVPDTEHFVRLAGLSPSTTYHFIIRAVDNGNNEVVSDEMSFTTSAYITEGHDVGDRAIDFTLPALDDSEVTLSKYRGQIVLINFWFTTCGGCVKELPYIEEIHQTWTGNKPLTVLTIDIRDFKTNVKKLIDKNGYTFTVLLDTDDTRMWEKYGVTMAPKTFFIDANGVIREIQRGSFRDADEIREILDSM
jgi:peroxiredoxin/ribosomal protein L40E